MKIMFYLQSMTAGGAERVVSSLANNFVTRGDEVYIMVTNGLASDYPLHEKVQLLNQNTESFSRGLISAIINNLRRISVTRRCFKEVQPDVVICLNINKLTIALIAKAFLGIKMIGSERSNPYLARDGRFWKAMKRVGSPLADGYIFSSSGARDYYPAKTRKKSRIIPNGIFADIKPENIPPLNKRKKNSISATGRLEPVKGFDILIQAFALFHEKYSDYILNIYGKGSEKAALTELIYNLNMENFIFLRGYVADISQKLCENTMFVLSSYYEGMPNALIEAMACGLPCIATSCDFGPAELINDGENGLLVPVGNVLAMAKAMERLASDSSLAEYLSQAALKIHETHSLIKITDQFHEYIMSIAKKL